MEKLKLLFIFLFINILLTCISLVFIAINIDTLKDEKKDTSIELLIKSPEFLYTDLTNESLLKTLEYYDVKHLDIVYAQAILETGNFNSKICKEYNNLFGLYDSRKKDFYKFNHWSESVLGYKLYVQNKYNSKDNYYSFLINLPYAEDSLYISKIKQIVKRNEDSNNW